ncbi:MAG: bifunctional diguanylate cyclase/phosphodiesterase [Hyphomicrobiales bacterium]|nr:bifunctional diguanylate cyclase/phosphodiesterase [Hyphomicrobiales bacterium]
MSSRWAKGDLMLITGLVAFGLFMVLGVVFVTRLISLDVLERDARYLATFWAQHVSNQMGRPAAIARDSNYSHGLQYADASPPRSQADGLVHSPAASSDAALAIKRSVGEPAASRYRPDELLSFRSGEHFSIVRRFALFRADRSVEARGPNFSARELRTLARNANFDRAFQRTITSGRSLLRYASSGMPNMPAHTARVFVPIKDGARVSKVMVVDTDQSSAYIRFSNAFNIAIVVSSALMMLGISAPLFVVWRRIRQQDQLQREIHFLAAHDPLTGLSNRARFIQHLARALDEAQRNHTSVAVLSVDLNRFKDINDALGHPIGDALLASVGERIREVIADHDAIAGRLGGNEFAILVEGKKARNAALVLARTVRDSMAKPHTVRGHKLISSISVGLAIGPADGEDPATLLKHAEMALAQAKASGDNSGRFYVRSMEDASRRRRELEKDLRKAIAEEQLRLQYQPQFDLITGRVIGYEALIRWDHPEKGPIPPDEFVPCAEQSGLIHAIGEWALRTGCRYAVTWPVPVNVAINLSAIQFLNNDLVPMIENILEETGIDPKRLEIEITESVLLHNIDRVQNTLRRLGEHGVAVALDDFGTGYSSLSYLARFPFNKLKIDQSFVHALGSSPEATAVIKTIVGLGRALDIAIVAEGVETEAQAEALRAVGCTQVQGFLYGRPSDQVLDAWDATVKLARSMRKVSAA